MSTATNDRAPRAPAVAAKLAEAEAQLLELEAAVAPLALAESEGVAGAKRDLQSIESKIEAAKRTRHQLRSAHRHALELDRKANAAAADRMRSQQMTAFKANCQAREQAMTAVLTAASAMAKAYGDYSEATLKAAISTPSGTSVPPMAIGPNGVYGPAFGPCERLILAELYRLAPERSDGIGRFVLPFARPTSEMLRHQPEAIPPGIGEFIAADQAIIRELEAQVGALADREMTIASTEKEAA
jgi:hypothetical protein